VISKSYDHLDFEHNIDRGIQIGALLLQDVITGESHHVIARSWIILVQIETLELLEIVTAKVHESSGAHDQTSTRARSMSKHSSLHR